MQSGKYEIKKYGQYNNNNTIKDNKNEKNTSDIAQNKYSYRSKYSKNNVNDDKDNKTQKNENVVIKREEYRSKYNNPQGGNVSSITTTTTTTTTTVAKGPSVNQYKRRNETKIEEPKVENKNDSTEQGAKRRFKYMIANKK